MTLNELNEKFEADPERSKGKTLTYTYDDGTQFWNGPYNAANHKESTANYRKNLEMADAGGSKQEPIDGEKAKNLPVDTTISDRSTSFEDNHGGFIRNGLTDRLAAFNRFYIDEHLKGVTDLWTPVTFEQPGINAPNYYLTNWIFKKNKDAWTQKDLKPNYMSDLEKLYKEHKLPSNTDSIANLGQQIPIKVYKGESAVCAIIFDDQSNMTARTPFRNLKKLDLRTGTGEDEDTMYSFTALPNVVVNDD